MANMVDNMLKRVIRRARKKLNDFLEESIPPDSPPDSSFDDYDVAYPWLNYVLLKLMVTSQGLDSLRPSYTWGLLHSAHLAKSLAVNRISAIEFGVAGGNGLVALENAAVKIEDIFKVGIDVYGFDNVVGLPSPVDYRDLPNLFVEGDFTMDVDKLKERLKKAELILGLVKKTLLDFLKRDPAPIGFISFDLDLYSSTLDAFKLLDADYAYLMPRIHCYFDDITGFTYSEFTGERLAIAEFNQSHTIRKISPIFALKHYVPKQYREDLWIDKYCLAHFFDHPRYGEPDGLDRRTVRRHTDLRDVS